MNASGIAVRFSAESRDWSEKCLESLPFGWTEEVLLRVDAYRLFDEITLITRGSHVICIPFLSPFTFNQIANELGQSWVPLGL